jgi:hypothetical protein
MKIDPKLSSHDQRLQQQIIELRYGTLEVHSRQCKARCSLPLIAKFLGIDFSTVMRLYRRYWY